MNQMRNIPIFLFMVMLLFDCQQDSSQEMKEILATVYLESNHYSNPFASENAVMYFDSIIQVSTGPSQINYYKIKKARALLEAGRVDEAIALANVVIQSGVLSKDPATLKTLAIAYMRLGEVTNCITNHSSASCILPIRSLGIHQNETGSRKAIEVYTEILSLNPNDLESKWLLNLAYMTLGEYPAAVPVEYLIPGMAGDTVTQVSAFIDIAGHVGLDINNMAGGSIIDDFNNDGYLDLVTSSWGLQEPMHYFENNAAGTFIDKSIASGLQSITGGLNLLQADYNNDGLLDILVLRGAWLGPFGNQPNSLLVNNGNGTFSDVTTKSGLLSYHPTQTATWSDFNNDGWLDLFIGNENPNESEITIHPCELYISNQDGTFREVAADTNSNIYVYAKGVIAGDYDNDGWQDLYVSALYGKSKLLRNTMGETGHLSFTDVTKEANLENTVASTFATWFFDYNNDGHLDIISCNYDFKASLSTYTAASLLAIETKEAGSIYLYKNEGNGKFKNVSIASNLTKPVFAMAANFGDIDNDGYLDMYFATGNPNFESLIPNKMYKNIAGKKFEDVTNAARVGHIQKGHGVSFADLDNDGDLDIYVEMGGAYKGDTYQNSLYQNTLANSNNWIGIQLEGGQSNRSAIGARIRIRVNENGKTKDIYREINSGGSFGASPLQKIIGVGTASIIEELEVTWPANKYRQHFKNIALNQSYKLTEGKSIVQLNRKTFSWKITDPLCLPY